MGGVPRWGDVGASVTEPTPVTRVVCLTRSRPAQESAAAASSGVRRPAVFGVLLELRARQGLLGLNWASGSWTLKSAVFAPSWPAVIERQVSGRALHVLASDCLLQSPAAQPGSLAAAHACSRIPCFVACKRLKRLLRFLLNVCWQA